MERNSDRLIKAMALGYLKEAQTCFNVDDYGKSFAFLLLALKMAPDLRSSVESEFCESWRRWSAILFNFKKFEELIDLYEQGCKIFCECEQLHSVMAEYFYKIGHKIGAYMTYRRALQTNPSSMSTRECLDNLCREIIDNWHYPMLNDEERNLKFQNAISNKISKLEQQNERRDVIDIGSGTGIMSIFAVQAGASSVTACEICPVMSKIGSEVIKGNGFDEKVKSLNCASTELHVEKNSGNSNEKPVHSGAFAIPQRAPLAICEIFDAGVFGEGIIKTLDHAWRELLLPPEEGGRVIPARVEIKMICIECYDIHRKHCGVSSAGSESTLSILLSSNVGVDQTSSIEQEPYTSERMSLMSHKKLSDYASVRKINFNSPEEINALAEEETMIKVQLAITENGYLDAIILCFDLYVDDQTDNVLKTNIGSELCWEQAVYPVRSLKTQNNNSIFSRICVNKDDNITLNLVQQHDKILLHSCEILNTSNGQLQKLSQLFLSNNCQQNNLPLLVLKEFDILRFNDEQFQQQYSDAFSDWLISRGHSVTANGESRLFQNGHSSLQNGSNHLSSNNRHLTQLSVLDLTSSFTKLALQLAIGHPAVTVHKISQDSYICAAYKEYVDATNLKNFTSLSSSVPNQQYDVVFVDVVEHSGLLHQDAFSNLVQARACLKHNGQIFPSKIKVMGMLFESEELVQRCSLSNDESTIGFNLGEYLEQYQATTLSHIDISKTRHTALSNPIECMVLDLQDADLSNITESTAEINLHICQSGTLHGIFLWFIVEVDGKHKLDTSHTSNSWLQCALMFCRRNNNVEVSSGECIRLTTRHNHSYIAADVVKITE